MQGRDTKTRRRFIWEVAGAAGVALVPGLGCPQRKQPPPSGNPSGVAVTAEPAGKASRGSWRRPRPAGKPRVVVVDCPSAVKGDGPAVHREQVARMLDQGLRALTGDKDARAALARFVRPVDTVGLKVNCLAGTQMSTHIELVESLVDLLQGAGLKRHQALVYERADRDLRLGGYPVRTSGSDYLSLGNDREGYERDVRVMQSGASRFAKVATRRASVLFNLPILKDHGIAGLSGALKNNFGLIHNPNKFHLNGCDPHVAEVNGVEPIRRKQRLVICDALRVQVEGGPAFHAAGAQSFGRLLLASDPVALDVVALELLEGLRRERELPSLASDGRPARHVVGAARASLGEGKRAKIELVEVKVS